MRYYTWDDPKVLKQAMDDLAVARHRQDWSKLDQVYENLMKLYDGRYRVIPDICNQLYDGLGGKIKGVLQIPGDDMHNGPITAKDTTIKYIEKLRAKIDELKFKLEAVAERETIKVIDYKKVYVVIEKIRDCAETRDNICYIFNTMQEAIRYVCHVKATSKSVVHVEEHELYSSFECNIIPK